MSNPQRKPILVLGATGKTGRRVMERLTVAGMPVRAGSRAADPPFDWNDQTTWTPVLKGVAKVYITFQPDVAVPGATELVRLFTKEAVAAGVEHLVFLSGRGEEEAQAAEGVVREAGVAWTILRASWFAQNFSESFLLEPLLDGHVALPAGDIPEPFVDVNDIADVAFAALTEPGHADQLYELTGPRMLTFVEAVAEIAAGQQPHDRVHRRTPRRVSGGAQRSGPTGRHRVAGRLSLLERCSMAATPM